MISPIEITGIHLELGDDIKKYIKRKVGRLDRYLPRHARESAHAAVKMRQVNGQNGDKYQCEVVLHLPGELITAAESTINMFAAVDIVEAKLLTQLHKYKAEHVAHRRERHRQALRKLLGRA